MSTGIVIAVDLYGTRSAQLRLKLSEIWTRIDFDHFQRPNTWRLNDLFIHTLLWYLLRDGQIDDNTVSEMVTSFNKTLRLGPNIASEATKIALSVINNWVRDGGGYYCKPLPPAPLEAIHRTLEL
jgi:hypothetical protein